MKKARYEILNIVLFPLCDISRIAQPIKMKRRFVVSRGWGKENLERNS